MTLVSVRGGDKVTANIAKAAAAIEGATIEAVTAVAMRIEREAKINQTPHVDTGRLRASLISEKKDDFEIHVGAAKVAPIGGVRFEVGSSVEYALKHEYQYPFMQPAVEKVRAEFPGIVRKGVREVLS